MLQQWYNSRQRWYFFTGNAGESASDTAGGSPKKPAHACHPKAGKRARYPGLSDYFAAVLREMQKHKKEDMEPTLWQEMTPDMRRLTKEEERRLFVQALCSYFLPACPDRRRNLVSITILLQSYWRRSNKQKKKGER